MKTLHHLFMHNAAEMSEIADQSIELVVTSPPYPMIQMWDESFCETTPLVADALSRCDGNMAFESMHKNLDSIWNEVRRVVIPGGIVCINIGDATRTIDGHFRLYPNHVRVTACFHAMGFSQLPSIIWRKPNNSPTKFMGSGMLPPGAYVTHEHEHLLIFRKGGKRSFTDDQKKQNRQKSAYFWEERNTWFSDIWFDLRGTSQRLSEKAGRGRSAAFPFELPFRLINMFSVKQDTVLDPFLGTGTTMLAAICAGRNCTGFEIDPDLRQTILHQIGDAQAISRQTTSKRLCAHRDFVTDRMQTKKELKHVNTWYGFPVMTRQEKELQLDIVDNVIFHNNNCVEVELNPGRATQFPEINSPLAAHQAARAQIDGCEHAQLKLF